MMTRTQENHNVRDFLHIHYRYPDLEENKYRFLLPYMLFTSISILPVM